MSLRFREPRDRLSARGSHGVQLLNVPALRRLVGYYSPRQVRVLPPDPPTHVYLWGSRSSAIHRCRSCGCVSHWAATDPKRDRMGVNARLMDPEVLAAARVRHLDGADTDLYTD